MLFKESLKELKNADILVTGGTGFFGKNLIDFFNKYKRTYPDNSLKVTILARNRIETHFSFINSDICSLNIEDHPYTHIIHAATSSTEHYPQITANTIIDGTRNILDYAKRNKVPNFLFISSGIVTKKDIDRTDHRYTYYQSKRTAEMYVNMYSEYMHTKIARCYAFVGPHMQFNKHFAIGNFIHDALFKGEITVTRDGPVRSYLHSQDLVIWLLEILFRGNGIYDVGSDVGRITLDNAKIVAKVIGKMTGKTIKIIENRSYHHDYYVANIDRANNELGLKVNINFEEAITHTVQWLLAQQV